MQDMKQFNGERLKVARTYRGLTVAELATKLGLQRQTVSMYENDKIRTPEYSVVEKMGDILNFPVDFFLEKDALNIKVGSTYFRSLLTTNKKYRNEQVQRMEFVSRLYSFLNDYIEFPRLNLPDINTDWDIEEIALRLREFWELDERPIENIVYLLEQNGIVVTSFKTSTDDVDAFSQMIDLDGNTQYLMGYSQNKTSASRIHFDLAHELGHILLHEWSEDIETLSKEEFKERENQAHSFASAFLLPAEAFRRDVGAYSTKLSYYVELKRKWKVSISAMIRRAYNLGMMDYNSYQQLMRTMQKNGIMKEEPLDDALITAKPSLLKAAVNMLLEGKVFTPQEFIRELSDDYHLSLMPSEIESLLDLQKDTLKIANVIPIHELNLKAKNN